MSNKLLSIFLFFLLDLNLQNAQAELGPYCNNIIEQNLLHKIENTIPQVIEVKINNNRKWQKRQ